MRIFGIDPGSLRTGYGCVETDGRHHRLISCGVLSVPPRAPFPDKLKTIYHGLAGLLAEASPDCVVIENLFHARNVRSALVLGHARGVAMLAAVMAGLPVVEYSPAEIKLAVTGHGRAEKPQLQQMVKMILGLDRVPSPHDAADALAVAICHAHSQSPIAQLHARARGPRHLRSWRFVQLPALPRRQAP
ncbi:MAG TPA: crossover junction endodeoxyribonuclease RuvC [Vicinamibacterales bacterium]|nr:crossover junction endodeoxyribonuclease RuvC [Vicinamibacterales bacterium]